MGLENAPVPKEPVSSDLLSATVGLPVVFQQTPLLVQFAPPVAVMFPLPVAVISPMFEIA
ncbi:hypothetical protein ES708_15172 [subsurface metagenome]